LNPNRAAPADLERPAKDSRIDSGKKRRLETQILEKKKNFNLKKKKQEKKRN